MSKARRGQQSQQIEPTRQEQEALAQLYKQNRFAEAESVSRSLISRFPAHGYGWKILGAVLQVLGQAEDSLDAQRKSVELLPQDHAAWVYLAGGLHQQGHLEEAVKSYLQALEIDPHHASSYSNLGDALRQLGHLHDSESLCRQAIELKPDWANAHFNLGNTLYAQDKLEEAQASYRLAIALQPDWAEAYNNLAMTLKDQGLWIEAAAFSRRVLEIKPDWAPAHSNLIHLMSLDVQVEAQQLYAENLAFAEKFETPLRADWQAHQNEKNPDRCLQVGFVSGDFCNHAVATFLDPLFQSLCKKTSLSLHAYATHTREDEVTQRLRSYIPHWHEVSRLSASELASQIRLDQIDILIDLSGHTAHNRLQTFAHKPAPIQVTWLGYPGTTGLQAIDYHMRDRFWIPPNELDWQFSEHAAFLPAWAIYQPNVHAPPVNTLPALDNHYITFGSFNRPNKINPAVIALWAMLLREVPSARMVLGAIPAEQQDALTQDFADAGIEESRLTFFARTNLPGYMALHQQVDFCLDTFPYGGGTTTLHAVWMGVPTLTLAGETPPSRMGATLMNQLGLDEFIATSIEDFVSKGRYWAEHTHELAAIRSGMRERFNASALGQAESFANSFEATLRAMWLRWCNDLPAAVIDLEVAPPPLELETLAQLHKQHRYTEAASAARSLISRFPAHSYAWKILGATLLELGQLEASLAAQKKTAERFPDDHEAHFNLACGLQQQNRLDEALESYSLALSIQPNNAIAYSNLGYLLNSRGFAPEAEAHCRLAIELQPDLANAHNSLGAALHAQGKFEEAKACYRTALTLKPGWPKAYNNLALTLKEQGFWSDAKDCYYRAIELDPDFSVAHSNLLYCLNHDVHIDPKHLYAEHLAFAEQFEAPLRATWQAHSNTKDPTRCLQVGFVSGDLDDHAISNFLEPALKHLRLKPTLALHAYHTHTHADEVTERLHSYFSHWHTVAHLSDAELADKIRSDGIDILIDLSGHTARNRLLTFARKPAPIQVSWLGYLGTTGLQAIDYYLCDQFWIPPGELDWQFTEQPAFLPAAVVFQPSEFAPPLNELPALGNGHITFGSFNRTNKINDSVIALWSMLLREVPSARMVLGAIPDEHQEALIESFTHAGVAQNRLSFYPRSNLPAYLALHHHVDFCLDTFPHGGGATTAHAAWMGIPTLSLAGETPSSRFGATLMHHLGLDEFIASSIEDFIEKGRYWAEHCTELAEIRRQMRTRFQASALGQPELFATHFDLALRDMWTRWCHDEPTKSSAKLDFNAISANRPSSKTNKIKIVSATKLSEQNFWSDSALGISLNRHLKIDKGLSVDITYNNSTGLPIIFNNAIEKITDESIILFIHDDVWINEANLSDQLTKGLNEFDIIGIAGNKRRIKKQPAWAFINNQLTWDSKDNLSGRISHGKNSPGEETLFGEAPVQCELLDGVFIAAKAELIKQKNIRFDAQFDFHFYDMHFCRSASHAKLKLGTWLINLTHQSSGAFGSSHWREKYKLYLKKWGE